MGFFLAILRLLGDRLEEEARRIGQPVRDVRLSTRSIIEGRLKAAKDCGVLADPLDFGDWLILFGDASKMLKGLGQVLKSDLPLGVIIGYSEMGLPVGSETFLFRKEILRVLKRQITKCYASYQSWGRAAYQDKLLSEPFFIVSRNAYRKLDLDYRSLWFKPRKSSEFYVVKRDAFDRKLRLINFLIRANISASRPEYREIENLFVETPSYHETRSILDKHNFVLVVGQTGAGKTALAMKLLLDYSKEYEPLYVSEDEWWEQLELIRKPREYGIEGKVICLEAIFIRALLEPRESFLREIGSFIDYVTTNRRCKVVVTSQPSVLMRLEGSGEYAENLFKRLEGLRVSLEYDEKSFSEVMIKSKNIIMRDKLDKWALDLDIPAVRAYKSWFNLMPFKPTTSHLGKINAFWTAEIEQMLSKGEYDSLFFLSLSYAETNVDLARSIYEQTVRSWERWFTKVRTFDELARKFHGEVRILGNRVEFAHPLYSDAFRLALVQNGQPSELYNKVFSPMLSKLSEKPEAVTDLVRLIAENFGSLPRDASQMLLLNLSEKEEVASELARALKVWFHSFSDDLRNQLLLRLSERDRALTDVARVVADNFSSLGEEVRIELLLRLAKKWRTKWYSAQTLIWHIDMVPDNVRKTLGSKLVCELKSILDGLSRSPNSPDRIRVLKAISFMSPRFGKDYMTSLLNRLQMDEDQSVRRNADVCMNSISPRTASR